MKILVTGTAVFIGLYLAKKLLERDDESVGGLFQRHAMPIIP